LHISWFIHSEDINLSVAPWLRVERVIVEISVICAKIVNRKPKDIKRLNPKSICDKDKESRSPAPYGHKFTFKYL